MTLLLSPPTALANNTFINGEDEIPEEGFILGDPSIPVELAGPLHEYLVNEVIPSLSARYLTFNNNPEGIKGVTVYKPEECWNGYTLLSSLAGDYDPVTGKTYGAVLIDMEGNKIKRWKVNAFPAEMLPGGSVIGGEGTFVELDALPLVELDYDGNELWRWDRQPEDAWLDLDGVSHVSGMHHDFQRKGVGVYYSPTDPPVPPSPRTTLILAKNNPPLADTAEISNYRLYDDTIYEIAPDGTASFTWYAYQHFEELGFSETAKRSIKENIWGAPNITNSTDWQHINTVGYVGPNRHFDAGDWRFHPDNIIWDGRCTNITAIIARHPHPEGKWDQGDIVWQIGPEYSHGTPGYPLGQIIGLHMAHIIPKGLPGEGNMMIFDNGGCAGHGPLLPGLPPSGTGVPPGTIFFTTQNKIRTYSRVIEFDPVEMEIVWEYKCREPREVDGVLERAFFSFWISGAQRLLNGNTLICEGGGGRVFEVTPGGRIVWEYFFDPGSGGDTGLGFLGANSVYRAYRIPYSWVPEELLNK